MNTNALSGLETSARQTESLGQECPNCGDTVISTTITGPSTITASCGCSLSPAQERAFSGGDDA